MNSKQVNETVNKLFSFMQNVKDGDLRTILVNMQKMNDYMAEKLRIYEERQRIERFPACRHRTDMGSRDNPKMVLRSGWSEIQQR